MKVLILSKACVAGPYQQKLEAMAGSPDLELRAVVPPYWRTGNYREPLRRMYVDGYTLKVRRAFLNGHFHLHFYPRLGAELASFRPDLVHIDEEPYNLATAHASFLARRAGARCLFFTWQNLLRTYPPPFSWFEAYCYRDAAAIAGSDGALAVLKQKGFRGPSAVIPQFGVDPDLFSPAGAPPANRPFTIGFLGRLVEGKGLRTLLQAFSQMDGDQLLRIAGGGPLEVWLRRAVDAHALAGRVEILGRLAPENAPEFIRSLDVMVLPSIPTQRWVEQFGRSLIEAMSARVAVIGADTGEIPNVVGDAGLLVPPSDPAALARALRLLRDNGSLRLDLAEKGRARVHARFTHARLAAATVDFYRRLLA